MYLLRSLLCGTLGCQHILEGDNMVADSLSCNNLPTFEAETAHLPSPTERVLLATTNSGVGSA